MSLSLYLPFTYYSIGHELAELRLSSTAFFSHLREKMDSLLLPEAARVPRGGGGRGEKLSVGTSELASSKGAGLGPAAPMGSVSRRSSVMTVPSLSEGGAHRLDLLIEEQV